MPDDELYISVFRNPLHLNLDMMVEFKGDLKNTRIAFEDMENGQMNGLVCRQSLGHIYYDQLNNLQPNRWDH